MNKETAVKAQSILNKIESLNWWINWMSYRYRVLCFCTTREHSDDVTPNASDSKKFKEILDEHHKQIIQELKDEVKLLENEIEKL